MKTSILTLGLLIFTLGVSAQDIKLPNPDMKAKTSTVIDALAKRYSTREFASTPLSNQELSNLCWGRNKVTENLTIYFRTPNNIKAIAQFQVEHNK